MDGRRLGWGVAGPGAEGVMAWGGYRCLGALGVGVVCVKVMESGAVSVPSCSGAKRLRHPSGGHRAF